jgi:hypothetical protein
MRGRIFLVKIYDRCLMTTEAIGNCRDGFPRLRRTKPTMCPLSSGNDFHIIQPEARINRHDGNIFHHFAAGTADKPRSRPGTLSLLPSVYGDTFAIGRPALAMMISSPMARRLRMREKCVLASWIFTVITTPRAIIDLSTIQLAKAWEPVGFILRRQVRVSPLLRASPGRDRRPKGIPSALRRSADPGRW